MGFSSDTASVLSNTIGFSSDTAGLANDTVDFYKFLGVLSLHLNHLIASCAAHYDWPFGTLPF